MAIHAPLVLHIVLQPAACAVHVDGGGAQDMSHPVFPPDKFMSAGARLGSYDILSALRAG
jgi:hypothetical protein